MGAGFAYVDGRYLPLEDARISILDPGFTHSDAVYDVVSAWKGLFFRLDDHIDRFFASCQGFRLRCTHDAQSLKHILAACVHRGNVADAAYCAVVVTRGRYSEEGARTRDISTTTPTLIAYAVPYAWIADPADQERGVHLIVAKTRRIPSACIDARFKNYHWGDLTQGKFEARAAGADLALHLSVDGFLTEGAGFNVFFVRDGRLYTPERNILLGITRQTVLDLARELGVPCEIGNYGADVVRTAEECFITSTAGGIMPITKLAGRELAGGKAGPLTLGIRAEYWRRREQGWLGTSVDSLIQRRHEAGRLHTDGVQ